jgi:hypothetical protein
MCYRALPPPREILNKPKKDKAGIFLRFILRKIIWQRLDKLNTSIVAYITGWGFIPDALFVSGFS